MPVLDGKLRNNSIAASNPPAEPPMPTIGQLEYCLADCNADFVLDDFNRDDFVPLVLIREEDALDIALRFAAMRLVMLPVPSASYNRSIETKAVSDNQS
jgi:hypothetical protein